MIKKANPITQFTSDKAKQKVAEIEDGISSGRYSTEEGLISAIDSAWRQIEGLKFESGMIVPAYQKGSLPMLADLQDPLLTAAEETTTLWEILSTSLGRHKDLHNTMLAEIAGLDVLIGEVQNNTTRFQLYITDDVDQFLWSSDSLTSSDGINLDLTDARINNGMATLKVTDLQVLNSEIANVSIDRDASVGIPGNSTTISSWAPGTNPELEDEPEVELVADQDPHSDISYLFDNEPNTWYEWEYVYIPHNQKVRNIGASLITDPAGEMTDILQATKNYGWNRFIQWPGSAVWDTGKDGKGLPLVDFKEQKNGRLVLNISMKSPTKLSAIQLIPHIINGYPKVTSILISRDQKTWETIAKDVYLTEKLNEGLKTYRAGVPERDYTGTGLWTLPEREVQHVRITLETTNSYIPQYGLGHRYYYRITEKHKSGGWFTKGKTWTEIERLPNPNTGILSNVSGNETTSTLGTILGGAIGLAIKSLGPLAGAAIGGPLISAMFGGKVTSAVTEEGDAVDVFAGSRTAIGIKSIDFSLRVYTEQSQIVTRAHSFTKILKAVSLISTETIPDSWSTATEWVEFYISPDGYTWHHIVPLNRSTGKDDVIFINSKTVYVKVVMKRPTSNKNETPILKNIVLKGVPA